jgi:hypothetical protein
MNQGNSYEFVQCELASSSYLMYWGSEHKLPPPSNHFSLAHTRLTTYDFIRAELPHKLLIEGVVLQLILLA